MNKKVRKYRQQVVITLSKSLATRKGIKKSNTAIGRLKSEKSFLK